MKQPRDLALRFLALADRDIKTFRLLADISDSDNQAVGFHAQQALEKCLKGVLAKHQIEVRKTHDLRELLDLIARHNLLSPPNVEDITNLSPYAVLLRYDVIENLELDRARTRELVEKVRRWAGTQIERSG